MPLDLSALKITDTPHGCRFAVKVVPGSSRNRIVGTLGQNLKVAIASPPEKGAANTSLLKLLAQYLNLRPAQIQIISGQTKPRKQILIRSLNASQLRNHLG